MVERKNKNLKYSTACTINKYLKIVLPDPPKGQLKLKHENGCKDVGKKIRLGTVKGSGG